MYELDALELEQRLRDGVLLYQAGSMKEAEYVFCEILQKYPDHAPTNYYLGLIAIATQRVEVGLSFLKTALELSPEEPNHWLTYIRALMQAGLHDDARLVLSYGVEAGLSGAELESLTDALRSDFNCSADQADSLLTEVQDALIKLFSEKRYAEAEGKLLPLLEKYPDWLVGWKILSDTYLVQGKDARLPASHALALNQNDAQEHCYYGLILKKQGDLEGAAKCFERAVALKPDYAAAYNNLGIVKKDMGDVEAGIRHYRKALALNPGYASCYSNLLFCLTHSEKISSKDVLKEHRQFSQRYEAPLKPHWTAHTNAPDSERVLQIGFVSADFRDHSLAYFLSPVLAYLSLSKSLSLHAFSNSALADKTTQRLHSKFQHWHVVDGLSSNAFAQKVRDSSIDILVDLSGHTAGNCLLTFAMKPAPIQVSWLGYLATSGLSAMDYYLADGYLLPPGKLDNQFTEKLVQLPANAPFSPSDIAPDVNKLPALRKGHITFANFNRSSKITRSAINLWAKLLHAVPHSKMLLGSMSDDGSYDVLIAWFAQAGIDQDRLEFYQRSSIENYLKLHHEVDLCLDTFPSSGVTTTCHAVWMGVPTLCLDGNSLTSRGAMAIMNHVGLADFVAKDSIDFVTKGIDWAGNPEILADIRSGLRDKFKQSALAKPEMLANSLERAFRKMWKTWCSKSAVTSFEITTQNKMVK